MEEEPGPAGWWQAHKVSVLARRRPPVAKRRVVYSCCTRVDTLLTKHRMSCCRWAEAWLSWWEVLVARHSAPRSCTHVIVSNISSLSVPDREENDSRFSLVTQSCLGIRRGGGVSYTMSRGVTRTQELVS